MIKDTQRAFLSFSGILPSVSLTGSDGKRIATEVAVKWTNSGTTPADQAVTRVNAQLWASELPDGFDFKDLPLPGAGIVPLAIGPIAVLEHAVALLQMTRSVNLSVFN
jgi:hypothetical protein